MKLSPSYTAGPSQITWVVFIIYFLLSVASPCFSVKAKDTRLLVQVGNKYGYINDAGQIVIATQYDDASEFKGAFASVSEGGKMFIIDCDGKRRSNEVLGWIRDVGLQTFVVEFNDVCRIEAIDSGEILLDNVVDLGLGYSDGHMFAKTPGTENLWFHLVESPSPHLTSTVFSMQAPIHKDGLVKVYGRDGHYIRDDNAGNIFESASTFCKSPAVIEINGLFYLREPDGSRQFNPHLSSFDCFQNNYLVTQEPSRVDGKYHLFSGSKFEVTNSTNRIDLHDQYYALDNKIYALRDNSLVLSAEECGLPREATIRQVGNGYAVLCANPGLYYYKYIDDHKSILHGPFAFVAIPPFESKIILICEKAEKIVELGHGINSISGVWSFRDKFGVEVYSVGRKMRYNLWSQFRPVEE